MFRYCGEYFDKETGTIYLRARYYSPTIGRLLSEDTHWNQENMIYGDKEYKDGEIKNPDINAIMQSTNLYVYCGNNPVLYFDSDGHRLEFVQKGYVFMEQVYNQFPGFTKNTLPSFTNYGNRIPDFINSNVIGEIKNVTYQSLTRQIRGFLEIAKDADKKFVLVIEEGARLSAPLVREISRAGGIIIRVGEKVSGGMKMVPFFIPEKVLNDVMNPLNGYES